MDIDYESKKLFIETYLKNNNLTKEGIDYKFSKDKMAYWDLIYQDGKKRYVCEIKFRNLESTAYKDTLIEESKYWNLIRTEGYIPILCVQFTDCYYIFNLNKVNPRFSNFRAKATTNFKWDDIITKSGVYINLKEGERFDYIEQTL